VKDFASMIKKYKTCDVIKCFARLSNEIYKKQDEDAILRCSLDIPFLCRSPSSYFTKKVAVRLSAWDIHNIQYLAIKHSTDHRGTCINNNQELATIVNYYRDYEKNAINLKNLEDSYGGSKYMFGLASEQFRYQNLSWLIQRFNMNYHILFGSTLNQIKINVNEIVKKVVGLSAEEIVEVYLIVQCLCSRNPDILTAPETYYRRKQETLLTKENIEKVVNYYTVTYEQVRESFLRGQFFCGKPFVKTKTGITLMTNYYLVMMLVADGLYWMVRDYYRDLNSEIFMSSFGNMFEDYFEELLSHYLNKERYERLSSKGNDRKIADYKLVFDNVTVLIELKTSLIDLQAKQQNPDAERIDKYIDKTIKKAVTQLHETEKNFVNGELKNKPTIKFIVLYENLQDPRFLQHISSYVIKDIKGVYIATIEDMEFFLDLYMREKDKAETILVNLIKPQKDSYWTLQVELINMNAVNRQCSYTAGKINHFGTIMEKLKDELE